MVIKDEISPNIYKTLKSGYLQLKLEVGIYISHEVVRSESGSVVKLEL